MHMSVESLEQFALVKLSGEVDLHNSREVKDTLMDQLQQSKDIIVDFSNLEYIDSSGMATLVEAFNVAKDKNLAFYIAGAKDAPLQVLKLTRLDSIFDMVDKPEQALEQSRT